MENNVKDTEQFEQEAPAVPAEEQSGEFGRYEADLARAKKKEFWDRITTALLVLVLASPFAVLIYIIAWFINKG